MTPAERETLEKLERSHTAPHQQVLRAKVLLMAADGEANTRIAEEVGVTPVTVRTWRTRFGEDGLAGLEKIRGGRGRKPSIPEETVADIVRLTTTTTRSMSCPSMATSMGRPAVPPGSPSSLKRYWLPSFQAQQLCPALASR